MEAILETERLKLRPFEMGDAERLADLIGDFDVSKMLARVPYPYSLSDAREFIARVRTRNEPFEGATYAIDRGGLIGCVSAEEGQLIEGEAIRTIGYWLAKPYWGKGYATEAARALVAHAFGPLKVAGLKSGHLKENHASGRVLAKLGFKYAGEGMKYCLARDAEVPHVDVVLTKAQWQEFTKARAA